MSGHEFEYQPLGEFIAAQDAEAEKQVAADDRTQRQRLREAGEYYGGLLERDATLVARAALRAELPQDVTERAGLFRRAEKGWWLRAWHACVRDPIESSDYYNDNTYHVTGQYLSPAGVVCHAAYSSRDRLFWGTDAPSSKDCKRFLRGIPASAP